ncbi:hypothetical protein E0700_01205 [Lactobacillus helveticus]|nr:hypothetical protein [Lactobacillus helveticus]MBW8036963.1 hypothetical protein [Lactobacillus helveticus]
MDNEIINNMSLKVYNQISERLKIKKKKLKFTREQIFESDIPLVSRVLNNRRVKNKNPYLLTPTLADSIVKKMNFKSTYELVWGENTEQREEFLECFFINGLEYLAQVHADIVNDALVNYFDYAYSKAMYDHIVSFVTTDVHEIITRYNFDKNHAIYDFVEKNLEALIRLHKQFFKNKVTTKLVKNIQLFYDTVFLKYVRNKQSEQGLNFYNLVLQVLIFEEKPLTIFDEQIEENKYFKNENIDELPFDEQIEALGGKQEPNEMENAVNKVVLKGKKFIDSILDNQQYLI